MFKKGDIVKCIDAGSNTLITNGKNYTIIGVFGFWVEIDRGNNQGFGLYLCNRFEKLKNNNLPKHPLTSIFK